MNENNRPTLCWFCAKLGKCLVLKPCKDFVKYDYGRKYTLKKVAELCGLSCRSLRSRLKKDEVKTLRKIYKQTGLDLVWRKSDKSDWHYFVEREDEE